MNNRKHNNEFGLDEQRAENGMNTKSCRILRCDSISTAPRVRFTPKFPRTMLPGNSWHISRWRCCHKSSTVSLHEPQHYWHSDDSDRRPDDRSTACPCL